MDIKRIFKDKEYIDSLDRQSRFNAYDCLASSYFDTENPITENLFSILQTYIEDSDTIVLCIEDISDLSAMPYEDVVCGLDTLKELGFITQDDIGKSWDAKVICTFTIQYDNIFEVCTNK